MEKVTSLLDFARRLQTHSEDLTDSEVLSLKREIAQIEELSARQNCVYSIYDLQAGKYIFYTSNLLTLAGLDTNTKWRPEYAQVLQDNNIVRTFIGVMLAVSKKLLAHERPLLRSYLCGAFVKNFSGKLLRLHYHHHPFSFTSEGQPVLSYDSLADVKTLMGAEPGFWIRFCAGDKYFCWHSDTRTLAEKDIVSPREKELIDLWAHGQSITDIAAARAVSVNTVKNQFNTARRRLLARDNTALVQLSRMSGILHSVI